MPRQKSRLFTDVELEFMKIIWEMDEASPYDINKALLEKDRSISIGSIRNVLSIMMQKGYLTRRKQGKAFLYKAKVHKDKARRNMLKDLLANVFEGSELLLVAALFDNRKLKEDELKEMRRLIDELKQDNFK